MAYNYTNPGWANGSLPAINAYNLNAISNLLAAMGHAYDNGGDPTYLFGASGPLGSNWVTALTANLGTNWTTALAAALGSNWTTALGAALGTNWTTALGAALGSGWTTALAAAGQSIGPFSLPTFAGLTAGAGSMNAGGISSNGYLLGNNVATGYVTTSNNSWTTVGTVNSSMVIIYVSTISSNGYAIFLLTGGATFTSVFASGKTITVNTDIRINGSSLQIYANGASSISCSFTNLMP